MDYLKPYLKSKNRLHIPENSGSNDRTKLRSMKFVSINLK